MRRSQDHPKHSRDHSGQPTRERDDRGRGASHVPEPALPDTVSERDLDAEVRSELRSLGRLMAERVARHLVAAGQLIVDKPEQALAHAMAARRLAPRTAAVREAVGLAAYHVGEWQNAIAELRAYHRMTGCNAHVAILADCERALGRAERAIDLYRMADRGPLAPGDAVELLIVAAGARGDLGQHAAAVAMLQVRELTAISPKPWTARLRYAYADALLAAGRHDEAREWFARAADADQDMITDAADRLLELDGVTIDDAPENDDISQSGDVLESGEAETPAWRAHGR